MKHEWSVRVRTESSSALVASARSHAWRIGEPISFAPKDELPTALETAVGALAADLIGSFRRICRLRRIDFERAELSLRFTLDNALAYIGVVGEEGTPALAEIEGTFYVSSLGEDQVHAAWQEAMARSPLFTTLSKAVPIKVRINVTP